jgi:hypothetical protein
MSEKGFVEGELVWSKFEDYPYWPSRVSLYERIDPVTKAELPPATTPKHTLVWFFGSHN